MRANPEVILAANRIGKNRRVGWHHNLLFAAPVFDGQHLTSPTGWSGFDVSLVTVETAPCVMM